MAAGFGALRDDDVGAVLLEPDRLPHNGRRRDDDATRGLDAPDQCRTWQAEVKADDLGLQFLDQRAHRLIERRAVGGRERRRRVEPLLL